MIDPHIEQLIIQLKNEPVRTQALDALVQIGAEAVEPLCPVLADERWEVRRYAAQALVKIGDERAVEPLCRALADKHWEVRRHVAQALLKFGDERAVVPLCVALEDENWEVRRLAAEALVRVADERAIQPLGRALADRSEFVRQFAADALMHIGHERTVAPLCLLLADENWRVRRNIAQVLVKLGLLAVRPLCRIITESDGPLRTYAAAVLLEIGNAETLPLKVLQATQLTPLQRCEMLEILRRVKYKDGAIVLRFPIPDILTYCQQQLQHPEAAVRQSAQAMLEARSLLRGSDANDMTSPGELVRPAMPAASQGGEDQLMRASAKSEMDTTPTEERKRGLLGWLRGR